MNSTQRKFLIEKIQSETKKRIEVLRKEKQTRPSGSNYVFKAILEGSLKLQNEEHILNVLKDRAIKSKEGENWLSQISIGFGRESAISFNNYTDILVMPDDYYVELNRVKEHNMKIEEEIKILENHLNTIEVRIQLASDSVLKSIINDVDDMGDIKLIDTTIKKIN